MKPPTRWLGQELIWLPETGSTNDDAMARARAGGAHGLAIFADHQTKGRGRMGRTWHSPAAENLYFSVLLRPEGPPGNVPSLTLAAGIAVCDALAALGCQSAIKWPNDVLIDGRKVAGILTEATSQGGRIEAVVLGVGVNVNTIAWPAELSPIATSVRVALGREVDRRGLAADLLVALETWLDRHARDGVAAIAAAWRQRAGMLGRRVEVQSGGVRRSGIARDIDEEGALWLDGDDGRPWRVLSGEVL